MNDDERTQLDEAVHDFWAALAAIDPSDRVLVSAIFVIGLVVGVIEGLGWFTPFYAVVLAGCGALMFWAIREFARSKL